MATIVDARKAARTPVISTAIGLLVFGALLGLAAAPAGLGEAGLAILLPALVFAGLRLVAAYQLWRGRRQGAILGLVATLPDMVLALPGALDAPTGTLRIMATAGIAVGLATLVALAMVGTRRNRA